MTKNLLELVQLTKAVAWHAGSSKTVTTLQSSFSHLFVNVYKFLYIQKFFSNFNASGVKTKGNLWPRKSHNKIVFFQKKLYLKKLFYIYQNFIHIYFNFIPKQKLRKFIEFNVLKLHFEHYCKVSNK